MCLPESCRVGASAKLMPLRGSVKAVSSYRATIIDSSDARLECESLAVSDSLVLLQNVMIGRAVFDPPPC